MIREPSGQISPDAVKVWQIHSALFDAMIFIILGVGLFLQHHLAWPMWLGLIFEGLILLLVLIAIYNILIHPVYLQKTWRYEIDEEHVQIKHGLLKQTHLIVPMAKVQYVETNQGPLLRRFHLRTIKVGTMASSHNIPALQDNQAQLLRTRIAFLAELTEEDGQGGPK